METPYEAGRASPMPRSLWAAVTDDVAPHAALEGHRRADVAVIGGGFMGIAAALRLAENGVDVVLLEASRIGWGASGRNNGLVAPGLKRDPDEVRAILGAERGERLLCFAGDAPGWVFQLVARHGIDCDASARGWIQAAHAPGALALIERRVRFWQGLGAEVELIPADTVAARLGTDFYPGAWCDPRGGSLNPLAFVRGLARAAADAGARLHEQTPALAVRHGGRGFEVTTPAGSVRSEQLLYCTNAYGSKLAGLRGRLIPLRTAQVASEPLGEAAAASILPGGESASDTQRLLTSFRITADRRLIMGGAGATAGDETPALAARLHTAARQRFPTLDGLRWAFGWSGYLALTSDHLPAIIHFADGSYAATACNGRGIAMATATGLLLAALSCGLDVKDSNIPIRLPDRIRGYGLRHPGVAVGVTLNRLLDRAERATGRHWS